jgi:hypothetical protein
MSQHDALTAEFHFIGEFRFGSEAACRRTLEAFAIEPAPIPPHLVRIDRTTVRLDYRTSSVPAEWPTHLVRAAHLAVNAIKGEMVCTYEGPAVGGHRIQRVRLTPRGGDIVPLPAPTVIRRLSAA